MTEKKFETIAIRVGHRKTAEQEHSPGGGKDGRREPDRLHHPPADDDIRQCTRSEYLSAHRLFVPLSGLTCIGDR